jgi:hypothetical protein
LFNDANPFVMGVTCTGGESATFTLSGTEIYVSNVVDDTHATYMHGAGQSYLRVKLHYSPGVVIEAKVWQQDASEPAEYQAYGVPSDALDSSAFIFVGSPSFSTNYGGVDIDYIDFDYDGKPCYQDCTHNPVDVAGDSPFINAHSVTQMLPSGTHGTGSGSGVAFLADYPFGDPLEDEARACFNIEVPADAITAGATHARVQGRVYSTSIIPPTYAVESDWVIYEGAWTGDRYADPEWDTCLGPVITSGSVPADGPYVTGGASLAGASYSEVDFIVPIDAEGIARFVLAFGAQAYVNGNEGYPDAVIVSAPRYPDFEAALVGQSDSWIFMQKPSRTTTNFQYPSEAFDCSYVTSTTSGGGIYGTDCVPVMGASASNSVGTRRCGDELVPQSSPTGGVYPIGTEWRTTIAAYIPGSTRLTIDGVFIFDYSEADPNDGTITILREVGSTSVVVLCYLTNGPLP